MSIGKLKRGCRRTTVRGSVESNSEGEESEENELVNHFEFLRLGFWTEHRWSRRYFSWTFIHPSSINSEYEYHRQTEKLAMNS
jgi:hypothetical protein